MPASCPLKALTHDEEPDSYQLGTWTTTMAPVGLLG